MKWGYVAGYFDGEGTVIMHQGAKDKTIRQAALVWHNTHAESLTEMQAFMGCGHIRVRAIRGNQTKPPMELVISTRDDMIRVGEAMLPHLIIKRERVQALIDHCRTMRQPRPSTHGKLAAIGLDALEAMLKEKSLSQVARDVGVSPSAVCLMMKRGGRTYAPLSRAGIPKSDEARENMRLAWEKRRAASASSKHPEPAIAAPAAMAGSPHPRVHGRGRLRRAGSGGARPNTG